MAEFVETGFWDLVVVDTPPAEGGLDFFLAPTRMRDLIGGRVLRWLTGARLPARRALYRVTARPVLRIADNVLGGPLLEELADFLLDLRNLYDGISARARAIERLFSRSAVLVVATAHPAPLHEARRFFEQLPGLSIVPRGVLFNRTLPDAWIDTAGIDRGSTADEHALADNLARWASEARHMRDVRREFTARYRTSTATVPWVEESPTSLGLLAALAHRIDGLDLDGITG